MSTKPALSYTASQKDIIDRFEYGLDVLKPALFNLAGTVIEASTDRRWESVYAEDTGARLLGMYIRKIFQFSNLTPPPMYFLGTSRLQRKVSPEDIYHDHIRRNTTELQPKTALVLTENIGLGKGVQYTVGVVERTFHEVDVATLVSRDGHHIGLGNNVYVGGEGHKYADAVVESFEELIQSAHGHPVNTPISGVVADTSGNSAIARNPDMHNYPDLRVLARQRMINIAHEYLSA